VKAPAWLHRFVHAPEGSSRRVVDSAPSETTRSNLEHAGGASTSRRPPARIGDVVVQVPVRSVVTGELELRSVALDQVADLLGREPHEPRSPAVRSNARKVRA
jgi:hypothetical protein